MSTPRASAPPALVAELANSHGGDVAYLRDLVGALLETRVSAVKFQPVIADEIVSVRHPQRGVFEGLELDPTVLAEEAGRVTAAGKRALFDVFGPRSLRIAIDAGAQGLKVHAQDVADMEFVGAVLDTGLPTLVSVGGALPGEIDAVVAAGEGRDLTLLVGFQRYPTPIAESRVRKIAVLVERYGVPVGYMDHVDRDDPFSRVLPCLAAAAGATLIEKHAYLPDRSATYDHESAFSPAELDELAAMLASTDVSMGEVSLTNGPEENAYRDSVRKVVAAAIDLSAGDSLRPGDYESVRAPVPDGESPVYADEVLGFVGREFVRDLARGDAITREALA